MWSYESHLYLLVSVRHVYFTNEVNIPSPVLFGCNYQFVSSLKYAAYDMLSTICRCRGWSKFIRLIRLKSDVFKYVQSVCNISRVWV